MNILYIISQIFGFSAFIISLFAYHRSKKQKIFQTMMIANILDILHYLLLGGLSGCITKIIALVRNELIIIKEKHKIFNNYIILFLLFILYIIAGIFTFKNIFSIFPILAAMIYLYFVWNGNELKVKKVAFYCYFLWLAYNIFVFSIAGIISNAVSIISTLFAVYNEKKNLNQERNEI